MPYSLSQPNDLPEPVRKLPARLRKIWVSVWNAVFAQSKSEERAFAIAWGAVRKARAKGEEAMSREKIQEAITERDKSDLTSEFSAMKREDVAVFHDRMHAWAEKRTLLTGFTQEDMNWFHDQIEGVLRVMSEKDGKKVDAESPLEWKEGRQWTFWPGDEIEAFDDECASKSLVKIVKRSVGKVKQSDGDVPADDETVAEAEKDKVVGDIETFMALYDGVELTPEQQGMVDGVLPMLMETGRRHSQSDIDLIDQTIVMLTRLRGEPKTPPEAEPKPEKDEDEEKKKKKKAGGPSQGYLATPAVAPAVGSDVSVEPQTQNALQQIERYCPRCKAMVMAQSVQPNTILGRRAVTAKCPRGHDLYWFEQREARRTNLVAIPINLKEAVFPALPEGQTTPAYEVEVTLVKPGWSANGNYYAPSILSEALDKFRGVKAFADHGRRSDEIEMPERSIKDIVGYYTTVWQDAGGAIRGTLKFVGESCTWLWPLIVETIKTGAALVELSLRGMGKLEAGKADGQEGMIVNELIRIDSVDVVTEASAGGRFDRLLASDPMTLTDDLLNVLDYDEWRDARPDFLVRLRDEMKTARKAELDEGLVKRCSEIEGEMEGMRSKLTEAESLLETERENAKSAVVGVDDRIKALSDAHEKALAEMRETIAAGEADHRARVMILEANLPQAIRERTVGLIVGKSDDEARRLIEQARTEYRTQVIETVDVPVTEAGASKPTDTTGPSSNPVARLLGVNVVPLPGESPEQYAERKRNLAK